MNAFAAALATLVMCFLLFAFWVRVLTYQVPVVIIVPTEKSES